MKQLKDKINEELILEYFISILDKYKMSINLVNHAEDRQTRENKPFISKYEIVYSIYKVAKQIRDDFDSKIIDYSDRIKIEDKSRNNNLFILCDISKDKKFSDYITLNIITEIEKNEMPTYDIKKTYKTYLNDSSIKTKVTLFKGMI